MGMIMHDDEPYGEGTSYTQGTGIAINNNIIAVDADNTPTENSEKPVKSKGVYEVVEQIYADNGVLGAKNLLRNNATSQTINGVTFTVNADKSVTVNGTATANTQFTLFDGYVTDVNKDVILSGSPANGSQSSHKLSTWNYDKAQAFNDYGEGVLIPASTHFQFSITIYSGYTANNLVFYPMLRVASDPDDTYVPYAMTNREITEELTVQESAVTDIVEGASVGSDYGNHLIKKGNIVQLSLRLKGVTAKQWETVICRIPEGYRPKYRTSFRDVNAGKYLYCMPNGSIQSGTTNFSNTELLISATWITD